MLFTYASQTDTTYCCHYLTTLMRDPLDLTLRLKLMIIMLMTLLLLHIHTNVKNSLTIFNNYCNGVISVSIQT